MWAYLVEALAEVYPQNYGISMESVRWQMGATNVREIISEWQKGYSGVTGDRCGQATHLYTKTLRLSTEYCLKKQLIRIASMT